MVCNSTKLDCRTKQHTESGVSTSDGSRDMARTRSAEKKRKKRKKRKKKKKMNSQNPIKHPLRGSLNIKIRVLDKNFNFMSGETKFVIQIRKIKK